MLSHSKTSQSSQLNNEMEQCIQTCTECQRVCLETVNYCLQMGGKHADAAHIGLLLDCAEMCRTSADFMIRESELHARVCAICAEVCERCADDCEEIDAEDEQMSQCVQMCRSCADSCEQMTIAAHTVM